MIHLELQQISHVDLALNNITDFMQFKSMKFSHFPME